MRMIDRRTFLKGSTAADLGPLIAGSPTAAQDEVGFVPDPAWPGPNLAMIKERFAQWLAT